MKTTIYVPDITCESCTRLIGKKLKNEQKVHDYSFFQDGVYIDHDDDIKKENLISLIRTQGFRASTDPFDHKTFKERVRDWKENKEKYVVEKNLIRNAIFAFLILLVLESVAFAGIFSHIPNFWQKYALWILYLDISIIALTFAVFHVISYKAKITCMTGMMIGMTFGMQGGMMLGAILGATNGYFLGALTGMLIGVIVGAAMGKCCGVMGIMEGMMAGLMGGTMGPMIAVMMLNDHLSLFMPIYIIINLLIVAGLSYMFIQEIVESPLTKAKRPDFITFVSVAIIITAILITIMVYGPRSALVGG
jgi:copper chaperone CopZ